MKNSFILLACLGTAASTVAQVTQSFEFINGASGVTFANGGLVPDGNPLGWSDTRPVSMPANRILDIDVTLRISGGYNGDLYGYLAGPDGGFSVLFNRVGRTDSDPFGYGDTGFDLRLDDGAAADIHNYQTSGFSLNGMGELTGTWQPDARNADPSSVTDAMARNAFLASFNNTNPNGDWTLYLADFSAGETSEILSWGVHVTAVPEPAEVGVAVGAALAVFAAWRKRRAQRTASTGVTG